MTDRQKGGGTTREWQLYTEGTEYNSIIGYRAAVDKNERFYRGDQWYGVKANGLPTPVFNIFKRIIDYIVSYIMSSPVKVKYTSDDPEAAELLTKETASHWEREKMDTMLAGILLDGAISGDMAAHVWWDPGIRQPDGRRGGYRTEPIDGANVYFGNVNTAEAEAQPYIIIAGRGMTAELRKEALEAGVPRREAEKIVPDSEVSELHGDLSSLELKGKTTFLIMYYKDSEGHVRFSKVTRDTVIKRDIDTGLTRYPLAFANWTRRKGSYHGAALGTNIIPNQVFINKMFAMAMKSLMDTAFPKAIYDKSRLTGWSNAVGSAIGVNGDVSSVAKYLEPGGLNANAIVLIEKAMQYTQECLGATDVLLGQHVTPDNTSAIIALGQNAAVPLESVRRSLYGFVESLALIWLDFITVKYRTERTVTYTEKGEIKKAVYDPERVRRAVCGVRIDVGPSAYWSELSAVNTLSNLYAAGAIDTEQYLKRLPDSYVPEREELLREAAAAKAAERLTEELLQEK